MPDETSLLQNFLEGLERGDPVSFAVVGVAVAAIGYATWRLLREELPPRSAVQWVRLISVVTAGAGAILGILGLVGAFSFAPDLGQHLALLGSGLFFTGFLVALISLTVELVGRTSDR